LHSHEPTIYKENTKLGTELIIYTIINYHIKLNIYLITVEGLTTETSGCSVSGNLLIIPSLS